MVVSNADPQRTFLQLVELGDLEERFLRAIRNYRSDGTWRPRRRWPDRCSNHDELQRVLYSAKISLGEPLYVQ